MPALGSVTKVSAVRDRIVYIYETHSTNDKRMSENREIVGEAHISPGARRMRAHRQRRRDGLRCVTLDLRETEIDRLIALGYLEAADRQNQDELAKALYWFLEVSPLDDVHQ
jgi:hypothetical protein